MPKRIAILLPSLRGGGAEKAMLNLANELNKRGYAVDMLLVAKEGVHLSQVDPAINIIDLSAKKILLCVPALLRYLRKAKPNVLLSVLNHTNIVASIAKLLMWNKVYLVISIRNYLSSEWANGASLKKKIYYSLARIVFPVADAVICVAQTVADDFEKLFRVKKSKIKVVYNPMLSAKTFEMAKQAPTHPWLNAQRAVPVILSVGRLSPQKDFRSLIEAFSLVRKKRDAKLIILGEGILREELSKLVQDKGLTADIDMPGFAKNPYCFLANCDLFVLSSLFEGIANVIAEALSLSPRIVSTDCPGGPRELLQNGRYGKLVEPGHAEALADAMLTALASPPTSIPESAWRGFTLSEATDRYLEVLLPEQGIQDKQGVQHA